MLSAVHAVVVYLSVRLSVCVSVTLQYCVKTAKRRITQIMTQDGDILWLQNFYWRARRAVTLPYMHTCYSRASCPFNNSANNALRCTMLYIRYIYSTSWIQYIFPYMITAVQLLMHCAQSSAPEPLLCTFHRRTSKCRYQRHSYRECHHTDVLCGRQSYTSVSLDRVDEWLHFQQRRHHFDWRRLS